MQLVQLQQAKKRFQEKGIGLVGVSYDSQAILKDFTRRQGITFSLLADPQSQIIQRFGLLNSSATGGEKGMAYPGYIFIGGDGRIKETFFEKNYTDRDTAGSVIAKLFPELVESDLRTLAAPHINLRLSQSDTVAGPGNRVTFIVEAELPRGVHVYAPGVQGYKPIDLQIDPASELAFHPPNYPASQVLLMPAIHEKVPVFEGKFRIAVNGTVVVNQALMRALKTENDGKGKKITVKGTLFYQACDEKICFLPDKVPVSWDLTVVPLDSTRVKEDIQHKLE